MRYYLFMVRNLFFFKEQIAHFFKNNGCFVGKEQIAHCLSFGKEQKSKLLLFALFKRAKEQMPNPEYLLELFLSTHPNCAT